MSDESSRQQRHDVQPPESSEPASAPAEPKRRNPLERVAVWGLIAVLAVVVGIEATARFGYSQTLNRLQTEIAKDEGIDAIPLHLDRVPGLVSGFPTQETVEGEAGSVLIYRWSGLLKDYGGIRLSYANDERFVIGLATDSPPEPQRPDIEGDEEEEEEIASAEPTAGES